MGAQDFTNKASKMHERHANEVMLLKKQIQALNHERQSLRGESDELSMKIMKDRMKIQDMNNEYLLLSSELQTMKRKMMDVQGAESDKQEAKVYQRQISDIINQMF